MTNIIPLEESPQNSGNLMDFDFTSELDLCSTTSNEVPRRVITSEADEELRRWYSVLKFCPLEKRHPAAVLKPKSRNCD
jgi:hypothetical protein